MRRSIVEKSVIESPDRSLGAIAGANLSEDGLDMGLHGRLGDLEKSRDMLVGISTNDALKYFDLARGQLVRCRRLVGIPAGNLALEWGRCSLFGLLLKFE